MSMDTEENTITSEPNTVISSVATHNDDVYSGVALEENPSYVEIPGNYALDSLSFDTNNSLVYSSTIASFDEDKTDSVTMCDDHMMSTNDVTDENIGDNSANNSSTPNRRVRFKYTKQQLRRFEDHFRMNMFPDSIVREEISKELSIPVRNVQVWFKNRRAKHRKSAQMDSSNSSSYLENSTMLPTPDRNASYHSAGGGYSFGNSVSQHYNPQNNPQSNSFLLLSNPFHGSSNAPNSGAMPSNNGSYMLNNQYSGVMGMPPLNSAVNNHGTQQNSSNTAAASNMMHYNQYRSNQLLHPPSSSTFYKNEHKYLQQTDPNMNTGAMNAPMYGSAQAPMAPPRPTPLGNNPFLLNVPPNAMYSHQHYHPQSMAQFNSSMQSQRPMFYHSGVNQHHPSSSTQLINNSNNNENAQSCNNSIKSEHKINDSNDNQHQNASNDKKLSKQSVPDYLHESYLNR